MGKVKGKSGVLRVFKKRIMSIILITVFVIGFFGILALFVIPKRYSASALLFVESVASSEEQGSATAANSQLVENSRVLFTRDSIAARTNTEVKNEYQYSGLSVFSVEALGSSEIIRITAFSNTADEAATAANRAASVCCEEFYRVIGGANIKVVEYASVPQSYAFPDLFVFLMIGLGVGLIGSTLIFVVREKLDKKIKDTDDLYKMYNIPVFAEIMDFDARTPKEGSYKYE